MRETIAALIAIVLAAPAPSAAEAEPGSVLIRNVRLTDRERDTDVVISLLIKGGELHLVSRDKIPKEDAELALDAESGFLLGKRHLILDRDPLYNKGVRGLLRDSGVKVVRLPRKSPNLNAHAERFVLSIKSEYLNRMMIFGEDHLRQVVREYMAHYHAERPHQGLGGRLIEPDARVVPANGKIVCHQRLGGLLRYYYRKAA